MSAAGFAWRRYWRIGLTILGIPNEYCARPA